MAISQIGFEDKVGTLTINEDPQDSEDLLEIVYAAMKYFPKGIWGQIEYFGNIKIKHNFQIKLQERVFGVLIFEEIVQKLKKIKNTLRFKGLLLALTHDPLIRINYFFEKGTFRRVVLLIHDYVTKAIGIVSFFQIEGEITKMITAHGLGHNQGLVHHSEPIDLMYAGLLGGEPLKKIGFCKNCKQQLEKRAKL